MSLGDLTVRINADTSGFTAGAQAVADGIRETQQTAAQASRSLASQAASLAATYRRQGMNMSDAMRRAWSEIERNSPQQRRGSHSGNNGAGGFFSGARDELSETNSLLARSRSGISALSSGIKSLAKTAAALAGVTLGVAGLVQAFKSYVSLESSVLRVNDLFKESAKYIEYFAAVTGKSLGMAESSAYEFAATYGNLFKNITKDTAENAKVTIAMLKASSVVASKTGRTMEDVMERIRSGLLGNTEAIEDLGINVNVAMLEVTDAFKQISNGRSWEQLTFYEQQQIRTLAILEQADKNFGNEVQTGSAYSLSVLSGAFKDLMSTAGAFINKALQPIIAGLTKITQAASSALKALAAVMGINLTGNSNSLKDGFSSSADSSADISDNMTDTVDSAKALKKQLAGFDELNVLANASDTSASDGGTSSSAVGSSVFDSLPELEYQEMDIDTSKMEGKLKRIKNVMGEVFSYLKQRAVISFTPIFTGIWDDLKVKRAELGQILSGMFEDIKALGPPLLSYFENDFTPYLQTAFAVAGQVITGLFDTFNTVFSDIWNIAVYPILLDFIKIGLPIITQFATEVWKNFGVLFEEVKKIFDLLWADAVRPVLGLISKCWKDTLTVIKDFWGKWGKPVFEKFREAIRLSGETVRKIWNSYMKPVWDKFMEVADELWTKHLKPLLANFLDFVGTFVDGALTIYNEFINPVVNWFVDKFGPVLAAIMNSVIDRIGTVIGALIDLCSDVIDRLKGVINFIVSVFKGDWKNAWESIKDIFKSMWDSLETIVKVPINVVIGLINGLTGAVAAALNGVIDSINGMGFTLPDWIPVLGGMEFRLNVPRVETPEIPALAKGGVVTKPTTALIGEAGKEAVMPLENNTGWIDKLAAQINQASGGKSGSLPVVNLYMYPNSAAYKRDILSIIRTEKARGGVV